MLLSILIPCLKTRLPELFRLVGDLQCQIDNLEFANAGRAEILINLDNKEKTTGKKRQELIEDARGEYVVFCDSDDEVSEDYVSEIMTALKSRPDVIGMGGYITTDGDKRVPWSISKDHPYTTEFDRRGQPIKYLRFNNHLSPIKRAIALKIGYPDMSFGEDYEYATKLKESGLIATEVYINKELYHYKYISKK